MAQQTQMRQTQVVVIGAGPGGYAAAFRAADHGMQVTLVNEDPRPGGVCLQRGCIPSKALLHVARLIRESREATECGVRFADPAVDIAALRAWKEGIIEKLSGGIVELARRRNVEIINARATFADSQTLHLTPSPFQGEGRSEGGTPSRSEGEERGEGTIPSPSQGERRGEGNHIRLRFDHAILAVGSVPAMPPVFAIDDPHIIDSTGALALTDVPKRLLVVGGGYIGLEMGTVYAALGSRVTVVEMTPTLLPGADRDLVRPLEARLKTQFEAILLNTKVAAVRAADEGIAASFEGSDGQRREEVFDRVLVAVGRRPNSRGIGLEKTQVVVNDRGFVEVDASMRTADPHILAIGDVAGEPMLAHKAAAEAKVAVDVLAGEPAAFDNVAIPAVVFTDPEIAWCGLTETQAKALGRPVEVAKFPWGASGRALTLGRPEGMTKVLIDPETERIVGVGIVGVGAGDLIAEGVLAVEMAAVAHDVGGIIHAHPTLAETFGEAVEVALGAAVHILPRKR